MLFNGTIPNLVISGINIGSNTGYHIVYSGTVAGAREAFIGGVPAMALSYKWEGGKSSLRDLKLAATEVCLPLINSALVEIKDNVFPNKYFLNIDVPTDVANHKGFRVTRQGKSIAEHQWKQVNPATPEGQTRNMDIDHSTEKEDASPDPSRTQLWFQRQVVQGWQEAFFNGSEEGTDSRALAEGYVSITPLGALFHPDVAAWPYLDGWLRRLTEHVPPSSL